MNVLLVTINVNRSVSIIMDLILVNVEMVILWTTMDKHVLSVVEVYFQTLVDPSRLQDGLMVILKKISFVNGKLMYQSQILYLKWTVQPMESVVGLHVQRITLSFLMV